MKRKIPLFILTAFIIVNLYGCAPVLVGAVVGAGALGGYALSPDTVEADAEQPYEELWRSAIDIARIRGEIIQENYSQGYIEFKEKSSRVWIKLLRLTRSVTRIKISARKNHLPSLALAQELYAKIVEAAR
ncbi:MAG: DUF3568 family protein [Candidatus Omnitrophota bacterium]